MAARSKSHRSLVVGLSICSLAVLFVVSSGYGEASNARDFPVQIPSADHTDSGIEKSSTLDRVNLETNSSVLDHGKETAMADGGDNETGPSVVAPAYSGPPRFSGPATSHLLGQSAVTSGGGPGDWKFGSLDSHGMAFYVTKLTFNITTPQSSSEGDTVFIGASVFDNGYVYDQMGIVGAGSQGGQWSVSQTSSPCYNTGNWCAYFSFGVVGWWSCATTYYSFSYGPLAYSESYRFTMSISGGTVSFQVQGPNGAGTVIGSGTWYTGGTSFVLADYTQECWNPIVAWDDFTDYEEDYGNNPVEAWPAFNLHTSIVAQTPPSAAYQISWTTYSVSPPTGFPGQYESFWNSPYNEVNISNENFASWVGTWFGNGEFTVQVSNTAPRVIDAEIDPLADPSYGFPVSYQYNFCSVPCGDVSFSPASSTVQADSYFYLPNAKMIVSLPSGFAVGTYLMALYAVESNGETYLTFWSLIVT
ncbi:MAG: hypothetical protein L3J68_00245 [Thermoplasmata archaeon]|nr:hypothetical protein [Thermoplasmata archaeon]